MRNENVCDEYAWKKEDQKMNEAACVRISMKILLKIQLNIRDNFKVKSSYKVTQ